MSRLPPALSRSTSRSSLSSSPSLTRHSSHTSPHHSPELIVADVDENGDEEERSSRPAPITRVLSHTSFHPSRSPSPSSSSTLTRQPSTRAIKSYKRPSFCRPITITRVTHEITSDDEDTPPDEEDVVSKSMTRLQKLSLHTMRRDSITEEDNTMMRRGSISMDEDETSHSISRTSPMTISRTSSSSSPYASYNQISTPSLSNRTSPKPSFLSPLTSTHTLPTLNSAHSSVMSSPAIVSRSMSTSRSTRALSPAMRSLLSSPLQKTRTLSPTLSTSPSPFDSPKERMRSALMGLKYNIDD